MLSPSSTKHIPILLSEVVQLCTTPFMDTKKPSILIDATLGGAGHTYGFIKALENFKTESLPHVVVAIDQDERACKKATHSLQPFIDQKKLLIINMRFGSINTLINHLPPFLKNYPILGCFADLGFSSDQLEDATYGISFKREGPLDMRLSLKTPQTCFDLLKTISYPELKTILENYGEETQAGIIARTILAARNNNQLINSTIFLSELIKNALQKNKKVFYQNIHPATKTFQALRIAVNQELEELSLFLKALPEVMNSFGHIGVLSFHSLEDRIVKNAFANRNFFERINKKIIIPSKIEQQKNPRSRSAKLRFAKCVSQKNHGKVEHK